MSVPIFIFPVPRFQTLFPVSECNGAYRVFSNTIYCHGRALGLVCYSVSNIARPLNLCAEAVILRQWKNTELTLDGWYEKCGSKQRAPHSLRQAVTSVHVTRSYDEQTHSISVKHIKPRSFIAAACAGGLK